MTLDSFHYEMRENNFAYYLVAENDAEKIIGFCGMWLVIDSAQITNVAVVEAARGLGIGEGLMREAMRIAKERRRCYELGSTCFECRCTKSL